MVRPQVLSPPQDGNCCTKISSIFQFFPSRLISYKWTWCCTAHLSDSLFVKHSSLVSAKSMVSREDLCKYYGVDIICPELGHEDETENCCNRCYLFAICEAFFCSQKTRVENCSKKVVNVSQVPALQGTWRFPAASCSVSLIMYRRGGHLFLFFFRETPATSMTANQSQLVPNTCCFKFFSLCFFVVAQIALVSDIWSSSCSSYWSFVWLIHSLSSSHPTCPPQLQPDADQITLYEVICQCSQPCSGWWCSTKIMWQGFC